MQRNVNAKLRVAIAAQSKKAFNRLAEYEELDLSPEEIKVFLADYAKMKELVSTLECVARR